MELEIREAANSAYASSLDTAGLRRHFLIETLFVADETKAVYSHFDRMIVGGVMPVGKTVPLTSTLSGPLRADYFLQNREVGIINIGGPGWVVADGVRFDLAHKDALYLGRGVQEVAFGSLVPATSAKFYFNSTPAHAGHPTRLIAKSDVAASERGSADRSDARILRFYITPATVPTCQLVMGMTELVGNSLWHPLPCHVHDRRMEIYFYFDMDSDGILIHLLGKPDETRHLIVHNEQAVIIPGWSVHTAVSSRPHSFMWSMAGENRMVEDWDDIPDLHLR